MKRTIALVMGLIFTLAVAALLWPSTAAKAQSRRARPHRIGSLVRLAKTPQQAQPACKSFVAVGHAVLPSSTPLADTDTWGGPLYATLAGEFLGTSAVLSGSDGEENWYEDGMVGVGKGGSYTVCTDYPACSNTFTYEIPFAVFPGPPDSLMTYTGYSITIVKGTGRFAGASGALNVRGPANAWLDDASPFGASGRWSAEITGTICGIQ